MNKKKISEEAFWRLRASVDWVVSYYCWVNAAKFMWQFISNGDNTGLKAIGVPQHLIMEWTALVGVLQPTKLRALRLYADPDNKGGV